MTIRILYPRPGATNGEVNMIIPVPNCPIPLEEVARKDTPAGVPYKIYATEDVIDDLMFLDAVEVDFSNPDGYGIGAVAWFEEQAALQAAAEANITLDPISTEPSQ